MTERIIRILIADDQALFAEGLRTIIESRAPDMKVVSLAQNGDEAIMMVEREKPDIILMDVRIPVKDGVEATKEIHLQNPQVKIVMLTAFDDDEYVKFSLSNGAIGYLLKNRPPEELIASIRAVNGGVLQIDPAVSKTLISEMHTKSLHDDDDFSIYLNSLTKRQRDVLRLLVDAKPNKQIAEAMNIAEQTVRNYISTIYGKLNVENRIEIVKHMDQIAFFLNHF